MNMILLISCVIVALCGWYGYKKGALQMIYGIAAWIFVVVLLLFGTSHVEDYLLNQTPAYDAINGYVASYLGNQWDDAQNEIITGMREEGTSYVLEVPDYLSANTSITAAVSAVYENLKVSLADVAETSEFSWRESVDAAISEVKDRTISVMASSITLEIIHVIAVVLLILFSAVVLLFVRMMIKSLTKKKTVEKFNKGAGLAAGIIVGVIVLQVLSGFFHVMDFTEWGSFVVAQIESTPLLHYLDQLNIFRYAVG